MAARPRFPPITRVAATRAGQRDWHEHCQFDQRSFKGYAVVGGTGALPATARLREATDEVKTKAEGDEATGAASSPSVFLESSKPDLIITLRCGLIFQLAFRKGRRDNPHTSSFVIFFICS